MKELQANADLPVSGVLLAAGESRRMGGFPKPLLPWGGTTVGRGLVTEMSASRLDRVLVVVGHEAARVRAELAVGRADFVENPAFREGMLSSVQAGVRHAKAGAWMFLLADQPGITAGIIDALLAAFRAGGHGIVVAGHNGRRGHPAIYHGKYGNEILRLDPQIGLRQLVREHAADLLAVPMDTPAVVRDMDTPAEYAERLAEGS